MLTFDASENQRRENSPNLAAQIFKMSDTEVLL